MTKQIRLVPAVNAAPGSQEWLEARRSGLGASEVPAILGFDPYRSGLDVWAEKRGMLTGERSDSPQATVGRFAEAMIAQLYEHQHDQVLGHVPSARHPELDILFASADRMAYKQVPGFAGKASVESPESWLYPVEIKNRGGFPRGWGEAGTADIPDEVAVQVIVQMACYDQDEARVAALLSGNDFRVYTIHRDRQLEEDILSRVSDWWTRHVVNGEEPPLTGASVDKYLARKFAQGSKDIIELESGHAVTGVMRELLQVKANLSALEEQEKALTNIIKAEIGERGGVKTIAGKALWSTVAPSVTFDAKKAWAIASDVIDAETRARIEAEAVTEKAGYRRFVLTAAKGV